jgi:hypothetical protein
MTTTERVTLIAVLADRGQADRAIDELRRTGVSYGQIRLVERGAGFFDSLKGWFTGMATTRALTVEDLRSLGVVEQDASFYQSELQAGHCLVLVNASGYLEQALSILRQNGAYDISARLRTARPTVPSERQEPGVRPETTAATVPPEPPPPSVLAVPSPDGRPPEPPGTE